MKLSPIWAAHNAGIAAVLAGSGGELAKKIAAETDGTLADMMAADKIQAMYNHIHEIRPDYMQEQIEAFILGVKRQLNRYDRTELKNLDPQLGLF